jgi:hypothetical protein
MDTAALSQEVNGKGFNMTTHFQLLYKTILKPIWTYGILVQLWGTASTSNIEILE